MNLMKKLVLIFLLLCSGMIAFFYYYWRQATHIPEWYTTQLLSTQELLNWNNSSELTAARTRLQEKIKESIAKSNAIAQESTLNLDSRTSSQQGELSKSKSVEIKLSDREVNDLVMTTVVQRLSGSQILPNTPRFHTTIKDGILETGTVINLANLSKNQLHPSESVTLNRAIKIFPFLEKQDVYVAISGNPKIENNQLKLDKHTKIKLGTLSLSVPELSQRLGIPQEKIEQNLSFSLQFGELNVKGLEVIDNQVLLKGWVEKSASSN